MIAGGRFVNNDDIIIKFPAQGVFPGLYFILNGAAGGGADGKYPHRIYYIGIIDYSQRKLAVLIHGGLGQIGMFGPLLPALAQTRQVIAVDLQAHGHTADIDRPLSFEAMADDVAALIRHLGLENADICGYSLGGGVALRTAIRHPDVVHKLVLISTPCKRDGWYPDVLKGMEMMNADAARSWVGSPMQQDYESVAPKPENWPLLADKLGRLLRQDYDWSKDVPAIKAPTLLVVGDADSVRTAHAVEFFGLLGGGKTDAGWDRSRMPNSRLAILPAATHYDIFSPHRWRTL